MSKTRFAIIGAGAISQAYSQAFQSYIFKTHDEVEVVGVADLRREVADSLGEVLNCPSFDSHTALSHACELDAVVVCTPPASHPEICHHFIDRGVHVLCEKPFAITVKEATEIVDAAKKKGVVITMASKFRYVNDVIRAKQIVDSGILGDIVLFENAFTARVDMASRWNSNPTMSGGGVLIDNGTHSFDIARYFLGPLSEVQVMEGKRNQGLNVEETVRIFIRSHRGVIGNIDLSWSINKELNRYISIYGSRGTVVVGWKEAKYSQLSSSEWVVFGNGYDKISAFRNQLQNFTHALHGEEQLLINGADAIASVEVVEAAYESLAKNHWTAVKNNETAPAQQAG
jgi:predicted dehydrogenase